MDDRSKRSRSIQFYFQYNRKKNKKFQLYKDTSDEFSFEELKDELEEIPSIPSITDDHLEDETKGPRIFKTYWKIRAEKSSTDAYIIISMGYARSLSEILKVILEL